MRQFLNRKLGAQPTELQAIDDWFLPIENDEHAGLLYAAGEHAAGTANNTQHALQTELAAAQAAAEQAEARAAAAEARADKAEKAAAKETHIHTSLFPSLSSTPLDGGCYCTQIRRTRLQGASQQSQPEVRPRHQNAGGGLGVHLPQVHIAGVYGASCHPVARARHASPPLSPPAAQPPPLRLVDSLAHREREQVRA